MKTRWTLNYDVTIALEDLKHLILSDKTVVIQLEDYLLNKTDIITVKHIVRLSSLFATFNNNGFDSFKIDDIKELLIEIKNRYIYVKLEDNNYEVIKKCNENETPLMNINTHFNKTCLDKYIFKVRNGLRWRIENYIAENNLNDETINKIMYLYHSLKYSTIETIVGTILVYKVSNDNYINELKDNKEVYNDILNIFNDVKNKLKDECNDN